MEGMVLTELEELVAVYVCWFSVDAEFCSAILFSYYKCVNESYAAIWS